MTKEQFIDSLFLIRELRDAPSYEEVLAIIRLWLKSHRDFNTIRCLLLNGVTFENDSTVLKVGEDDFTEPEEVLHLVGAKDVKTKVKEALNSGNYETVSIGLTTPKLTEKELHIEDSEDQEEPFPWAEDPEDSSSEEVFTSIDRLVTHLISGSKFYDASRIERIKDGWSTNGNECTLHLKRISASEPVAVFADDVQSMVEAIYSKFSFDTLITSSGFRYLKVRTRLKGKLLGKKGEKVRYNDDLVDYTFDLCFDYIDSIYQAIEDTSGSSRYLFDQKLSYGGLWEKRAIPIPTWEKAILEQVTSWHNSLNKYKEEPYSIFRRAEDTLFISAHVINKKVIEKAKKYHYPEKKSSSELSAAKAFIRNKFHSHRIRTVDLKNVLSITFSKTL